MCPIGVGSVGIRSVEEADIYLARSLACSIARAIDHYTCRVKTSRHSLACMWAVLVVLGSFTDKELRSATKLFRAITHS